MVSKLRTSKQAKNEAVVAGTQISTAVAGALATSRTLPEGITLKRRLTLPSLVLKTMGEVRFLAVADAIRASKVPGKKKPDGTYEDPATICTVGDVQTGEVFTWLVPAVVKSVFVQEAPENQPDWYVGKCFMIENRGKREGRRHTDFSVTEVDASALTAMAAE
jgi:hypothetical protein